MDDVHFENVSSDLRVNKCTQRLETGYKVTGVFNPVSHYGVTYSHFLKFICFHASICFVDNVGIVGVEVLRGVKKLLEWKCG